MGHNDLCVTSEHHFCGMENKVNKLKIIWKVNEKLHSRSGDYSWSNFCTIAQEFKVL
jgi:hypothetical protein